MFTFTKEIFERGEEEKSKRRETRETLEEFQTEHEYEFSSGHDFQGKPVHLMLTVQPSIIGMNFEKIF